MCIYRHLLCGVVVWAVVAGSFPAWAQQGREVSVDGLIYDLAHPDGDRRKAAARLLGQNKADRAVPGLIDLTDDVRSAAPSALDSLFIPEGESDFPDASGHYSAFGNKVVAEQLLRRLHSLPVLARKLAELEP